MASGTFAWRALESGAEDYPFTRRGSPPSRRPSERMILRSYRPAVRDSRSSTTE
jgi:hypothetical protein